MDSTFSRSRHEYQKTVSAPMSIACVPTQTQCDEMRVSSQSSTRMACTRAGGSMPRSFSAARQNARLFDIGEM